MKLSCLCKFSFCVRQKRREAKRTQIQWLSIFNRLTHLHEIQEYYNASKSSQLEKLFDQEFKLSFWDWKSGTFTGDLSQTALVFLPEFIQRLAEWIERLNVDEEDGTFKVFPLCFNKCVSVACWVLVGWLVFLIVMYKHSLTFQFHHVLGNLPVIHLSGTWVDDRNEAKREICPYLLFSTDSSNRASTSFSNCSSNCNQWWANAGDQVIERERIWPTKYPWLRGRLEILSISRQKWSFHGQWLRAFVGLCFRQTQIFW